MSHFLKVVDSVSGREIIINLDHVTEILPDDQGLGVELFISNGNVIHVEELPNYARRVVGLEEK